MHQKINIIFLKIIKRVKIYMGTDVKIYSTQQRDLRMAQDRQQGKISPSFDKIECTWQPACKNVAWLERQTMFPPLSITWTCPSCSP